MSFCLSAVLCKMDHRIWSSYIYSYDPLRQELKHIRGTSCYKQQYTSSATCEISVACCGTEEICVPIDEVPSGASHGNLGTKLKSKMARKHYVCGFWSECFGDKFQAVFAWMSRITLRKLQGKTLCTLTNVSTPSVGKWNCGRFDRKAIGLGRGHVKFL